MADARDERHRYGQHYTPREVARLLAAFAVRAQDDLVFDPSCGDGRLLAEALQLKRELSPARKRRSLARGVYGVDRSRPAIELAAGTGAQVAPADFFDIEPGAALNRSVVLPGAFDAIIGNPPYIRQELMGSRDKGRIVKGLEIDRAISRDAFWPRWSGRSDIYVYFFARAIRFLKERGRLAFLTASSWLDVGYGAALREFLLENFRVIAVIESAAESFFSEASINTAITVLAREDRARVRDSNSVRFVQLLRPLAEVFSEPSIASAVEFARSIERASKSASFHTHRIRIISQRELSADRSQWQAVSESATGPNGRERAKGSLGGSLAGPRTRTSLHSRTCSGWGKFLRADDVFFRVLERGAARLQPLSGIARVRFGVKTGANEFFYVTEDGQRTKSNGRRAKGKEQRASGFLALSEVASVRRGITTGANEFFYLTHQAPTANPRSLTPNSQPPTPAIEPQYLSPVVFSLKEIPGILLHRAPMNKFFFNCPFSKQELTGTRALSHITQGERAGFHKRPTCKSRDPWYAAARGMKPAPLIFPSKVGERWVVALNRAGVFEDKKLYGVFPASGVSELVLAALLNSTWARYYAEVTCRQMTGAQAIADIDVAVAGQIMIPDPRQLSPVIKKRLEAAVVKLSGRPVYSIFEEVKRRDRRRLDELTLQAIGFAESSERETVLEKLYQAATRLVQARLAKSGDH